VKVSCLLAYERLTLFATECLRNSATSESDLLMRIGLGHKTHEFELGASQLIPGVRAHVDFNRLGLSTKNKCSEY
jgi:hypothetical protein